MFPLLIFLVQLLGFLILYSTSARAVFKQNNITKWLKEHSRVSKITGSILVLISFGLFIDQCGIGVGFFVALVSLMAISGFIIILVPLGNDNATE